MLVALLAVPVAASVVVLGGPTAGAGPTTAAQQATAEFTVLLEEGASRSEATAAVTAAGGTVLKENTALGTMTVRAPDAGFVQRVAAARAILGATHLRPIGRLPQDDAAQAKRANDAVETENAGGAATQGHQSPAAPTMDPLDDRLWGLRMVRADLARDRQDGDRKVTVGVLDSGVDATHPDLAPNLNLALSRNFTQDIPFDETGAQLDGPCEFAGCVDPAGYDDSGHGTHVAGTIAAAANGFGISGVAPGVTLVSIRGGQDSGFVFLQPVLDALTYGADIGLDVINMSFYIDPWLYNCRSNPADSPEAQLEQRTTIAAVNRALRYAHNKGVTLIGSAGNNHEDLGHPRHDFSSPDYPAGMSYERVIDNADCLDLPTEGDHVISVSALGPTTAKADYSNYGIEQTELSAPGGWFRDGFGTPAHRVNENLILSAHPRNVGVANGWIDAAGEVTPAGVAAAVQKHCVGATCAYYRYLQGTSMASPHASGVAALVVSEYGSRDRRHGGLTMDPDKVERALIRTAFDRPCPTPRLRSYANEGRSPEFDALCEGSTSFNGFYGNGVVDAFAAVTRGTR